jgi:hypothetical protein
MRFKQLSTTFIVATERTEYLLMLIDVESKLEWCLCTVLIDETKPEPPQFRELIEKLERLGSSKNLYRLGPASGLMVRIMEVTSPVFSAARKARLAGYKVVFDDNYNMGVPVEVANRAKNSFLEVMDNA